MKIIAVSDTHNRLSKVVFPEGDILVHAGDLTGRGERKEVEHQLDILEKQDYSDIIIIAGNHDWLAEREPEYMKKICEDRNLTYLDNSGIEVDGIKFWGSPWTHGEKFRGVTEIVSGGAKGIDSVGEEFANDSHILVNRFDADWEKHGKAAGPIRNKKMAEYADALLLIWDGKSKGSANMKKEMLLLNKPIYEVILKVYNVE